MAKGTRKILRRTVKPGEDIVASMAEGLRAKLLKLIDQGVKVITIDLINVNAMDVVGLRLLIATSNSLKRSGGELKIKNICEGISKLLKAMKLDQDFDVIAV